MHYAHMHSSTFDPRLLVDPSDREHKLWLAMRLAYDNYREASEALDAVSSRGPIAISCRDRIHGIESLAVRQRIEFEKYIEKRMEYSEFVRDQSNFGAVHSIVQTAAQTSTASNQRKDRRGLSLGGITPRIAVAAALLCMTVVILHEHRRIHDLDAAVRDEANAHSPSRQLSASQLSASGKPNQLASRKVVTAPVVYSKSENRRVLQPDSRITHHIPRTKRTKVSAAVVRMHGEPIRSSKSEGRSYYWFTLAPSTQFKQVGTVSLSLRKDPKPRYFDLCLMVEDSKVEKKRVKLDVPIWIGAADRLQSVAVVVTRIEKNYVQGYLSEPSGKRPVTTATDQARQRIRRRS